MTGRHDRINQVHRRLARLLDLSGNIFRNEQDNAFVGGQGGDGRKREIIYVFDQTVMEMFMALDDETRKYPAIFHLQEWRDTSRIWPIELREPQWMALNRQSAVIASEYLLSGSLPGQLGRQFYLTKGHFRELANAVDRLTEDARAFSRDQQDVARCINLIRSVASGEDKAAGLPEDIYLRKDLDALFGNSASSGGARSEFKRTRQTALALTEAEGLMRLKQLHRTTSRAMLSRLVPLDLRFPDSRFAIGGLDRQWHALRREWRKDLGEANKQRSEFSGTSRPPTNLDRDADAIARVQMIARSLLGPHERIAYVTGDALLIGAYEKWHKKRLLEDPSEPRVLRSIQQYAPILNLGGMETGITDPKRTFDMLREGVETPLVAFNLSAAARSEDGPDSAGDEPDWKQREQSVARRSDLALRLDGIHESFDPVTFFRKRLTPQWYGRSRRLFKTIAQDFREFERIGIGLNTRHIETRAHAIVEDLARWDDGAELSEWSRKYIEQLLEGVVRQSVDLWFPLALENLDRPEQRTSYVSRTPKAVHLRTLAADPSPLLVDVVDTWLTGNQVPAELTTEGFRTSRYLVFAAASLAAHRLGRWILSHRFAQLAMSAAASVSPDGIDGAADGNEAASQHQELRLLRAISCRMRIGSRGPSDLTGEDVWATWLDEGIAELDNFVAFHAERGHPSDELRGVSERAALRGFYASWWPILDRRLGTSFKERSSDRGYSRSRAVDEFRRLNRDLAHALELLQATGAQNDGPEDNSLLQVYANVAASYALTTICRDFHIDEFHASLDGDQVGAVVSWWRGTLAAESARATLIRLPPLVRFQLAIFFRDHDLPPPMSMGEGRATPRLELDRELSAILITEIERGARAASQVSGMEGA